MGGETDRQTDRQRVGGLTLWRVDAIVSLFHRSSNKMYLLTFFFLL